MSYLSMVEAKLPPGFRFHPRDDELICDYLAALKVASSDDGTDNAPAAGSFPTLVDIDLNKCEPWDLPDMACVGGKEWYFFNLRDRKYATGQRTNRATMSGYWKATGKDRQAVRKGTLVGMRKTLVFYQGRAPKGKKTDWVMHEFRMEGRGDPPPRYSGKEDWVLCRVFYKSRGIGMGTKVTTNPAESCCDDTGSSSLPALTESYIAFDHQTFALPPLPPPTPPPINTIAGNFVSTAATSLEQVPCFSNYVHPQISTTIPPPQQCVPLMERNKALMSIFDHLSKFEGSQKSKRDEVSPSSESYLTEAALSSSVWYPFQS